jgi:hypothetical protein
LILQVPYGVTLKIIWYNIIPQDHKSAFDPYTSLFNTSGAIYRGEPKDVWVKSSVNLSFLQNPKSASLSLSALKNILSVLISLWTILF